MILRRHLFVCGVSAIISLFLSGAAVSENYPNKPVHILIGFSPGSATDVIMRIIAPKLTELWGNQVVIINTPGAGGNIAATAVARANPDGYTLLFANAGIATGPSLYKDLQYNPLTDLAPVALVTMMPHVVCVTPSSPVRSISDLIALARSKPGQLLFSSAGIGNSDYMAAELFAYMTNIKMTHVPSSGGPQALYDVIQGQATVTFTGAPSAVPAVKGGTVRAIAVTSAKRSPAFPEIPTMQEAGVADFEHTLWNGLFAPAATPPSLVSKLNSDIARAMTADGVRERFTAMGIETVEKSPAEFKQFFLAQSDKYAKVIKAAGIEVK
jgi:tripartite-type tricarboxylate transporter receptor subunit TctC